MNKDCSLDNKIDVGKCDNLIGKTFDKLTVLYRVKSDKRSVLWKCLCDCGNYYITSSRLKKNVYCSCGCVNSRSLNSENRIYVDNDNLCGKIDLYNIKKEIIGCAIIDVDDLEICKNYTWFKSKRNSVEGRLKNSKNKSNKIIKLHRLVMGVDDKKIQIDHINHDILDNRKINLRMCSNKENQRNKIKNIKSKFGINGVFFHEKQNRYLSYITFDKKRIHIGSFKTLDEAINSRIDAEKIYFKDFAPNRSAEEVMPNVKL